MSYDFNHKNLVFFPDKKLNRCDCKHKTIHINYVISIKINSITIIVRTINMEVYSEQPYQWIFRFQWISD